MAGPCGTSLPSLTQEGSRLCFCTYHSFADCEQCWLEVQIWSTVPVALPEAAVMARDAWAELHQPRARAGWGQGGRVEGLHPDVQPWQANATSSDVPRWGPLTTERQHLPLPLEARSMDAL